MQNRFGLLDTDMMPIFMIIALDIFITLCFSINCSIVICSPTVLVASWEKPLMKPTTPGSILHHISFYFPSYKFPIYNISFRSTLFAIFYFLIYTKNIYIIVYLSLSDLTFASNREGIDNPFIAFCASCLIVCAGIRWFVRYLLLDWYIGSQTEGNTYLYFDASPFPL